MRKSDASLNQAAHLLEIVNEKDVSGKTLQRVFDSGLLSDLFEGDLLAVDRLEFRKMLGLEPRTFFYDPKQANVAAFIGRNAHARVDEDISELVFDESLTGEWEYRLVCLEGTGNLYRDTIAFFGVGWRLAGPEHLLAFDKKCVQKRFGHTVVAAGGRDQQGNPAEITLYYELRKELRRWFRPECHEREWIRGDELYLFVHRVNLSG